ncbi:MAG: DUF2182 domain-containing protein [Candidatus Dormibacteria bacterium]
MARNIGGDRLSLWATSGVLVMLAAVAWALTVRGATGMDGMASGLVVMPGVMAVDFTAAVFLLMWLTMMVAMMFPAIGPMVHAHRLVTRRRAHGLPASVVFVASYLAVWASSGLVALALLTAARSGPVGGWIGQHAAAVLAGVLVVTAAYQVTPLKTACLRGCRSPMTFLMTHNFAGGWRSAGWAGLSHGLFCLGCCWALMLLLVAVGVMNLALMAMVSLFILLERNWRHGVVLGRVVAVGLALAALIVLLVPGGAAAVLGSPAPMGHM